MIRATSNLRESSLIHARENEFLPLSYFRSSKRPGHGTKSLMLGAYYFNIFARINPPTP